MEVSRRRAELDKAAGGGRACPPDLYSAAAVPGEAAGGRPAAGRPGQGRGGPGGPAARGPARAQGQVAGPGPGRARADRAAPAPGGAGAARAPRRAGADRHEPPGGAQVPGGRPGPTRAGRWPPCPSWGSCRCGRACTTSTTGPCARAWRADCVLDAYPDRIWKGTVRAVSPIARADGPGRPPAASSTCSSPWTRPAPELMRPGMSVRIEVVRRRARDVLLVPRVAAAGQRRQDPGAPEPAARRTPGRWRSTGAPS